MSTQEQREMAEEEYERRLHQQNLTQPSQDHRENGTAEILRYLSQIDDLPIDSDDPVMGQLISVLSSTANLSPEQVKSNEWVREYILVLYLCLKPTKEGMHSTDRAWAHGDLDAYRKPIDTETRAQIETFVTTSKLALTRSEDMAATKEAVRNVQESILNDDREDTTKGGIRGRLGL